MFPLTMHYYLRQAQIMRTFISSDLNVVNVYCFILTKNALKSRRKRPDVISRARDGFDLSYLTPIRTSDVARGLGLPYETTRRHIKTLCDRGLCTAMDDGVVASLTHLSSDSYAQHLQISASLCDEFVKSLKMSALL